MKQTRRMQKEEKLPMICCAEMIQEHLSYVRHTYDFMRLTRGVHTHVSLDKQIYDPLLSFCMCTPVLQCVLQCMLQCVLQCVAVCCNVLQCLCF